MNIKLQYLFPKAQKYFSPYLISELYNRNNSHTYILRCIETISCCIAILMGINPFDFHKI